MTTPTCPNCIRPVKGHKQTGCVLKAFISILQDRGTKTRAELQEIHANCDIDRVWDDLGPILDRLEAGEYNV